MPRFACAISFALVLAFCAKPEAALPFDRTEWSQKVERFTEYYLSSRGEEAEKEILAAGKQPVEESLCRLLAESAPSDPLRLKTAFTMAILGIDNQSSRAVLLEYCQPETRPDEDKLRMLADACLKLRDARLLEGILQLIPGTDGAGAEVAERFLATLASQTPRDLLVGLKDSPRPIRHNVSHLLACNIIDEGKSARQAYPLLVRIARDPQDSLQSHAERLLKETDDAINRIKQQRREDELRRQRLFPLIPPGLSLPGSAGRALAARYPNWHIMGTSGFDKVVVGRVRGQFGENATPQICHGDFDRNGLKDFALMLRKGDEVKTIVLRQLEGKQWATDELSTGPFSGGFQTGHPGFSLYITPRSPGIVAFYLEDETGKTGRLELKNDGIEIHFYGKASMLYYWTGKGYSKVQTGD